LRVINVKPVFFIILYLFIFIFNLTAVSFSGLNLSADDRLLFNVEFEGRSALFLSALANLSIQQITAIPEKMYLVDDGKTILTLSRFGAVKIPVSGGLPSPLPGYPSFSQKNIPLKGSLQDIAASSDGRWFLYIEPVSYGYGNLILIDNASGAKKLVSEQVELPDADIPVKWSPDSRLFVYSKGGRLFYFPIIDDISVLIDERFRMIGSGGISSVLWGQQGDFYYFTGSTLYRVINPELFTRTIYGDFLSIGNVVSVIPFDFDPGFDRFWIAPDSGSILINKGSRGLFFFLLGENRYRSGPDALPHVPIQYGAEKFNVFWPAAGPLTINYSIANQVTSLRFEASGSTIRPLTVRTSPSSPDGIISPDGTRAVFWGEGGLELWDYVNWRLIQRLVNYHVFSCAWINNRQFISGSSRFIEEIDISSSSYARRRISLSSADEYGFEDRAAARILVRNGSEWFANNGTGAWTQVSGVQLRQVSLSSDRFRVFLEPLTSGYFKNTVMIRNIYSTGTSSFAAGFTANSAYSQGRQTQIALCFDLYDDDTGLPYILAALKKYNIRATFFLNGEFIRRNPAAAASVAEAGHELGSMFYAPIDLSDTRYRITHEFISQGLARNEDEFYRATGRELSTLWHPPFYRNSVSVNSIAAANGYTTIDRSIDPNDWISAEDTLKLNLRQMTSAEMIEQVMRNITASEIIPVRLGLLPGGRDEYLYQRIHVLLDALIRSGRRIVPVSAVMAEKNR